jgi:hypothetical protein
MSHATLFIGVAQQQGYSAEAAQAALTQTVERLRERGDPVPTSFFIYRAGVGAGEGSGSSTARPRTLLAFRSADTALVFAQRSGLARSPRLLSLSLPQLLAVLVQRPTIGTLVLADEIDATLGANTLPPGFRLERSALIELLQKGTPDGQPLR